MSNVKTEAKQVHVGHVYKHPRYGLIFVTGSWCTITETSQAFRFRKILKNGTLSKEGYQDKHDKIWWKVPGYEVQIKVVKSKEQA